MLPFLSLCCHLDLNLSFARGIPVFVSAPTPITITNWSQGSELLPWSRAGPIALQKGIFFNYQVNR